MTPVTADVRQQEPVFFDTFLAASSIVCAVIGMPLAFIIIAFIITRRRLHQPRNIIWLGISFSNLLIQFAHILEVVSFFDSKTTELCRLRYFLMGLPYASLLLNNFLSLIDRSVSVIRSIWYHRFVTVRLVIGIQLTAFLFLCFLMKIHYIFGLVQVKCNVVHPLDRQFFFTFAFIFLFLCLSGQLLLYFYIKYYLVTSISKHSNTTTNAEATQPVQEDNNAQQPVASNYNEEERIGPEEAIQSLQVMESNNIASKQNNRHFVIIRDQMVSQLELAATRNVILGVASLLLFCTPWTISTITAMVCHGNVIKQGLSAEETALELVEQCSQYRWAASCSRELLVIHSIYQSIFYFTRSRDFSAALGRE